MGEMPLSEAWWPLSRCHIKGGSSLRRSWGHPEDIEGGESGCFQGDGDIRDADGVAQEQPCGPQRCSEALPGATVASQGSA